MSYLALAYCGSLNHIKVIEHKPYDHKADVFSFAIVLWELLTGEVSFALIHRFLLLNTISISQLQLSF